MTSLELSQAAEDDLADISDYGIANFAPDVAFAYMRDLDVAMDRLTDFPALGATVTGTIRQLRAVSCRRHRIFYRLEEDTIFIVRILHHKMDVSLWLE